MKSIRRYAFVLAGGLLLLSACNDSTGPRLPDPKEPGTEPRDSIPGTGSVPRTVPTYG